MNYTLPTVAPEIPSDTALCKLYSVVRDSSREIIFLLFNPFLVLWLIFPEINPFLLATMGMLQKASWLYFYNRISLCGFTTYNANKSYILTFHPRVINTGI